MEFNSEKYKMMHFGKLNPARALTVNGSILRSGIEHQYFGVEQNL